MVGSGRPGGVFGCLAAYDTTHTTNQAGVLCVVRMCNR